VENILPGLVDALIRNAPPDPTPDLYGMTSAKVKTLLNRLVSKLPADEAYLEIGCWQGASVLSALNGNLSATAYACDMFSEFTGPDPRTKFFDNKKKYAGMIPDFTFFEMDCFALCKLPKPFLKPIGVYFYDGNHSEESQLMALTEYRRFLAKRVVFLVDDWNWDKVRAGTWKAISIVRPKSIWFRELPSAGNKDQNNFWNGVGAFHLVLA
jgi:hypothetical protein